MKSVITQSYSDLTIHKSITELIKRHSENKEDIRAMVHGLIDWAGVKTMLDIGCGYGWFEQGLNAGLDLLVGIDYLEQNRDSFLKGARRIAAETEFRRLRLPATLEFPDSRFDLIVSCYSLYFFPGVLGEVARVLDTSGTFLVVTHSEHMLEEGERFFPFDNLRKGLHHFSAESGEAILREHFTRVTAIDYVNSLVFSRDELEDLATYIDFKAAFISMDVAPEVARAVMLNALEREGTLSFNKNDRIFVVQK